MAFYSVRLAFPAPRAPLTPTQAHTCWGTRYTAHEQKGADLTRDTAGVLWVAGGDKWGRTASIY